MENSNGISQDQKLFVCLFSDSNFLAVNILENLLSKNCVVNVVTDDIKGWKEKTFNIVSSNRFTILLRKDFNSKSIFNYSIFCGGFVNRNIGYADLNKFLEIQSTRFSKTIAIFPFEIFDQRLNNALKINDNLSIIYIGDLIGPRIDLESDLLINQCLN